MFSTRFHFICLAGKLYHKRLWSIRSLISCDVLFSLALMYRKSVNKRKRQNERMRSREKVQTKKTCPYTMHICTYKKTIWYKTDIPFTVGQCELQTNMSSTAQQKFFLFFGFSLFGLFISCLALFLCVRLNEFYILFNELFVEFWPLLPDCCLKLITKLMFALYCPK